MVYIVMAYTRSYRKTLPCAPHILNRNALGQVFGEVLRRVLRHTCAPLATSLPKQVDHNYVCHKYLSHNYIGRNYISGVSA